MNSKICSTCKIEKDILLFSKYRNQCKECIKVYNKQYNVEHEEEIKENNKQYYAENKDKIKEYQKEYRIEHKEEIKENSKLYYSKNKEEIKEYQKQSYVENKEEKNKYSRQYNAEHKEEKREYNKQYYTKNKEELKEYQKQYNVEHKEEIKENSKLYYSKNKEEIKENKKQYKAKHKEKIKDYHIKNKEDINKNKNEYEKNRKKTDPAFKLRKNISGTIYKAIHKNGSSKNGQSTFNHLPYTPEELKNYLKLLFEHWMSWENHGRYNAETWNESDQSTWTWNLDHITPQTHLPYTSIEDNNFKICWALENLRPYNAKKNIEEGDRKSQEEIIKIKSDIKERLEKVNYTNINKTRR